MLKSWTWLHAFREVLSFVDKAAVKQTFQFALTLQRKQVFAVGRDVCLGIASSYSAHFLEGAAFKASQASGLLTSLLWSMKSKCKDDLEPQFWLALSSVENTKSFLGYGQIAQSDTLGALMHSYQCQLNIGILGQLLSCLCLYLAPWHHTTLCYSDFMSESLMPALEEVIVASHEDTTHESTHQMALLPGLPCGGEVPSWCYTRLCPRCSWPLFV